ncbi:MAG: hypothetical protein KIH67_003870 [Candidatus Moranbacteria bacterium]|nr:hypothetical protein [Candidatus Moranbacteria bacterium]
MRVGAGLLLGILVLMGTVSFIKNPPAFDGQSLVRLAAAEGITTK